MIAFYLRLSESDGDLGIDGKNESNSIENQRLFLNTFFEAREDLEGETVEYVDDGYSGTNFDRPAFKRMIEDAKKGIIKIIIVKDLSRLGRDYIVAGDYIEQIFPLLRVRFIAVNNGYDSFKYTSGTMGFDMAVSNLINTFYSRDLSKKLKAANKVRWEKGINTSGRAAFGYLVDSERKGKWKIDPEAAEIVRYIFDLALEGKGTAQIAYHLNEKKYPTPSIYNAIKKKWKMAEIVTTDSERLWSYNMVLEILRRYEYTGALVIGRRKSIFVGDKRGVRQPWEKVTVVENVNEPIVSLEEFEQASLVIKSKQKPDFIIEQSYPLKGRVRCGNCRNSLCYNAAGLEETLYCGHSRSIGKHSRCCKEDYSMKRIEALVMHSLEEMIHTFLWLGDKAEKKTRNNMIMAKKHAKEEQAQLDTLKADKIRQYELYAEDKITKEAYLRRKQELIRKIEDLETEIKADTEEVKTQNELRKTAIHMTSIAGKYDGEQKLSRGMVEAFIKNVYVYDKEHIEITYLFEDEIKKLLGQVQEQEAI